VVVAKHMGGETVKGGVYWSMTEGEFISVPGDGGILAGSARDQYMKAPLPLVLILGPVMGLAFAMFLPLSGLLVLIPFLAAKMRGAAAPSAARAALQPGVSYLEPGSGAKGGTDAPVASVSEAEQGKLVDLAKEIAARRWKDK
jgi:hypothetical protein